MKILQAIRGMHDVLPQDSATWLWLEQQCREVVRAYHYQEIRTPALEMTQLFCRSIGEATDIVEKEMYTFNDRNEDSLTLRPEGTAPCVRACVEHGLLHNQTQRLWYIGPMFRHERPQKGRYRQFYQLGVEAYGFDGAQIDIEVILLAWRLWQRLDLVDAVSLQINTLGSFESRAKYREALVAYLSQYENKLDDDSKRRLTTNPLRILDTKNAGTQKIIAGAPKLEDYLSDADKTHFECVITTLKAMGLPVKHNPYLVRGLDYYCHTVFEWVTDSLGAQGTICAGGRYDGLVEQLGGKPTPAVGFAAGLERLVLLLQEKQQRQQLADVYCVLMGDVAVVKGLQVAERLRDALPQLIIETNLSGGSFKSQFKKADKSGARFAIIIGEEEARANTLTIKPLREASAQQTLSLEKAIDFLKMTFTS